MDRIKALIQDKYKDVSLNVEASELVSTYKKRQRKKFVAFAGTAVCFLIAIGIFIQSNPKATEHFTMKTGELLNNLFATSNTADITKRPTKPTSLVTSSTTENKPQKASDPDTSKAKSKRSSHNKTSETKTTQATDAYNYLYNETTATEQDIKTANSSSNKKAKHVCANKSKDTKQKTEKQSKNAKSTSKINSNKTSNKNNSALKKIKEDIMEKRDAHKQEFFSVTNTKIYTNGDYKYIIFDNGTAEINEYSGYDSTVDIPEELDGHKVASIGQSAFYGCADLTKVTIPDSVLRIEKTAFHSCINLKSIVIPDSVKSIGKSAFSACTSVSDVIIGNGVSNIENTTFQYCENLTSVTIGNSVESIGYRAFYRCYNLKSVFIPDNVKNIGDNAFGYRGGSAFKIEGFTIRGEADSEAERYAKKNGFTFKES